MKNFAKKFLITAVLCGACIGSLSAAAPQPIANRVGLVVFPHTKEGFNDLVIQLHHDVLIICENQWNPVLQASTEQKFNNLLTTVLGQRFIVVLAVLHGWLPNEIKILQGGIPAWTALSDDENLILRANRKEIYNIILARAWQAQNPVAVAPLAPAAAAAGAADDDEPEADQDNPCGITRVADNQRGGFKVDVQIPEDEAGIEIASEDLAAFLGQFSSVTLDEEDSENADEQDSRRRRLDDDDEKKQ